MNFFSKIEVKYIIIQIIAFNFIVLSPQVFSYLTDMQLSQLFLNSANSSVDLAVFFDKNKIDILKFNDLINTIRNYQIYGFVIGCLICIWISSKRKISWFNSLMVIILSFLIIFLKYASFPFKPLYFENWFNDFKIYLYFSGSLFLLISLSLFYLSYKVKLN
ncbi:hypothetical protein [Chryseobacterium paludis]|uniref:hypothetical protein n=1 Tax=Chryseobacterium paludis TaxID=2956784 RepID=UPI0021BEBC3D|nr:hypothetical protein [Chryseobacterium paludis]